VKRFAFNLSEKIKDNSTYSNTIELSMSGETYDEVYYKILYYYGYNHIVHYLKEEKSLNIDEVLL
jgi:hypothetical protein